MGSEIDVSCNNDIASLGSHTATHLWYEPSVEVRLSISSCLSVVLLGYIEQIDPHTRNENCSIKYSAHGTSIVVMPTLVRKGKDRAMYIARTQA